MSLHRGSDGPIPIPNIRHRRYQGLEEKYRYWREIPIVSIRLSLRCLPFGQRTQHEQQRELSKERVILKDELRNLKDELMAELIAYRCVIKVELFAILGTFVG